MTRRSRKTTAYLVYEVQEDQGCVKAAGNAFRLLLPCLHVKQLRKQYERTSRTDTSTAAPGAMSAIGVVSMFRSVDGFVRTNVRIGSGCSACNAVGRELSRHNCGHGMPDLNMDLTSGVGALRCIGMTKKGTMFASTSAVCPECEADIHVKGRPCLTTSAFFGVSPALPQVHASARTPCARPPDSGPAPYPPGWRTINE